jgi:hypothetical protein
LIQIYKKIVYNKKVEHFSDVHINRILKQNLSLDNKYKIIENKLKILMKNNKKSILIMKTNQINKVDKEIKLKKLKIPKMT